MLITAFAHLTENQVSQLRELVNAATRYDDLAPLSEHVLLHINHGGDAADEHLLATKDEILVGYLHLDQTDLVAGPVVEIVVHPRHRGQGVGTALVEAARERAAGGQLRLWAHGELNSAHALANKLGFSVSRELWQMRRSLLAPLPRIDNPENISIRPFNVGRDESEWLELNAQVFADHPEQGQLTESDLGIRMKESWFNPDGFLVAVDSNESRMVGFHWTKIHGGHGTHDHARIGETYVLGVDLSQRGTGLAKLLVVRGLEYLREQEIASAMLYVDAHNEAAKGLYESLGFSHWDTDVMFTAS